MTRDWRSMFDPYVPYYPIFDPSEPYYSTESYATWAYGVPFTDYDRAFLAEMNINLETK